MNAIADDYIINGGQPGKSRLNVLAGVLHGYDEALLKACGLAAGMSFLDIGCGGGHVAMMAATIVGANGNVMAIDFDEEIISLARQDAVAKGIHNVSFGAMNAYYLSDQNEYDIAHARFLLSHLDKPLDVLARLKQSVKPGGKIIIEDVHFDGHFCYPFCEAFNKYVGYYIQASKQKNEDANIGPSLVSLFRSAGIEKVSFDVIQPAFNAGPGKWMAHLTLNNIKDRLIAMNIAGPREINEMLQQLEDFTNDQQTIVSLPRIFRVWGTKGKDAI